MAIKQVLWSGGLDSTYLIYKLLQEGHSVEAFYVKIGNNPAKTKRELLAIKKLCKLFAQYDFKYSGILLDATLNLQNVTNKADVTFYQSPIWLLSCFYLAGPVSIGYVLSDESISYLDDYRKIIRTFNLLRNDPLKIEFPLIKVSKQEIIRALPKEIYKYITYCEDLAEENCNCSPCIRHRAAQIRREER